MDSWKTNEASGGDMGGALLTRIEGASDSEFNTTIPRATASYN